MVLRVQVGEIGQVTGSEQQLVADDELDQAGLLAGGDAEPLRHRTNVSRGRQDLCGRDVGELGGELATDVRD